LSRAGIVNGFFRESEITALGQAHGTGGKTKLMVGGSHNGIDCNYKSSNLISGTARPAVVTS